MSPTLRSLGRLNSSSKSIRRLARPQVFRRLYSSEPDAKVIASEFLTKTQSNPPYTQTQLLDANQLQRFSATFSRSELAKVLPKNGTPLPAGYHLAYFTPAQVEEELGRDGTDTTFNPPSPYTRRMWAGGELEWVKENKLRVGQEVTETTRLVSAYAKKSRVGNDMIIVSVEKKFQNEHGVALIDKRNWVFREEITKPQNPARQPEVVPLPEGKHVRDFNQTPVTLFRFSALTFNAHKIHYSKEWCREVEGHRGLVVHGPLNLINMLNFWRDLQGGDATPKKITYRATNPLYAGEPYRIIVGEEAMKVTEVKIVDSYGQISMQGTIESF
ncbi:hypothetical protein ONS95_005484 [Cadophora gregata]|uniref:uncharacterized protein n=1 Tax=Cadophora gregata TaxID=51156 RepID=UPI0026DDAB96|nr:uncharacterized protein ONS95_005484 [Cadophora gregata]KAK0103461.1 hypothetical protein ONS95_005484 [Cadophora gregata]KAK0107651.1 hypothetical protein ONS96_003454 [Cadophora gregata f. sp. sojae]